MELDDIRTMNVKENEQVFLMLVYSRSPEVALKLSWNKTITKDVSLSLANFMKEKFSQPESKYAAEEVMLGLIGNRSVPEEAIEIIATCESEELQEAIKTRKEFNWDKKELTMNLQELMGQLHEASNHYQRFVYKRDMMIADAVKASPFATDITDADDNITVLIEKMKELESAIKPLVVEQGESVRCGSIQAVYTKGRASWDTDKLEQIASTHPFVNDAKKVGQPSVSIRK